MKQNEELTSTDNPEAINETSPYEQMLKGELTREQDLERTIRDRGRGFVMLFLVLLGSVYGNLYQLRLPKNVPYIHNVAENGQVVTRILLRPDEVPVEDPYKQAFIKTHLKEWIINSRLRSVDTVLMVRGINSALRMSAGPARIKLSGEIQREDIASRVKRETVEVLMAKAPVLLAGNTWQAEWEEIVRTASNIELRRETWSGSFQLAEQPDWVTEWNAYGVRIVDKSWAPLSK